MQLEKDQAKKDEDVNIIEEFFSKKNLEENHSNEENLVKEAVSLNQEDTILESQQKKEKSIQSIEMTPEKHKNLFLEKIKQKAEKLNIKYIVAGLVVGIIANISIYHYQSMDLQNKSQKLAAGLLYNLSENNDLEQIARNIYLGMKDSGWEPTVKLSNGSVFVFELDKGAEFTITKSVDVISTKFHISVDKFSSEMIKSLLIQLEPSKIGGTKNFITNKKYDPRSNSVSFDIEKIGEGNLSRLPGTISFPPLTSLPPNIVPILPPLSNQNIDPKIISIPISQDLDNAIIKNNKNINTDSGINIKKENKSSNKEVNIEKNTLNK